MGRQKKEETILNLSDINNGDIVNELSETSDNEIEETSSVNEPEYVFREIRVDTTTTKRKRIEVKEFTCRICGYDALVNHGRSYDGLTPIDKSFFSDLFSRHKEIHTPTEKRIITGSELPNSFLQRGR